MGSVQSVLREHKDLVEYTAFMAYLPESELNGKEHGA